MTDKECSGTRSLAHLGVRVLLWPRTGLLRITSGSNFLQGLKFLDTRTSAAHRSTLSNLIRCELCLALHRYQVPVL